MKSILSIPAFILILANVAAHALGGWSPVPGIDFSSLAGMGIHHYLQMAVLLLLLLLARGGRDRFYPGLAALITLLGGIWLGWVQPGRPAVDLLILPLSWMMCALCAASAASGAVPPPEERPGLVGFRKAVGLLILLDFGLLVLFWLYGPRYRELHEPILQATAVCAVFSLWLLTAAGRWANLSFIAGLAGVLPPLTALLVLTGQIGRPLEELARYYSYCLHFQMALLTVLSGLVCLISLAVKAGVRLTGRARKPVRSKARALFLFPAGALFMAAVALPAGRYGRPELPDALYQGETTMISIADLQFLAPAGYAPGQVQMRRFPAQYNNRNDGLMTVAEGAHPLAGDWMILAERRWASAEEADAMLADLDRRLRSQPENAVLGGDHSRLFGRPAWLVLTSTHARRTEGGSAPPSSAISETAGQWDTPPSASFAAEGRSALDSQPIFDLELYIFQPGGALKLGGVSFARPLLPGGGETDLAALRRSVDEFLKQAADLVSHYRWLTAADRSRPVAFRTAFGAFDQLPQRLRLSAVISEAAEFRLFSSENDWTRPPSRTSPHTFSLLFGQAADQALLAAQARTGRGRAAPGRADGVPAINLSLRWGYLSGRSAGDDRRISAWPSVDRGLHYYRGYRFSRPKPADGLPGVTNLRYFRRPPLSPAASADAGLRLTWIAADSNRPPLEINFTAELRADSPETRTRQLAEALGRWRLMLGTFSRSEASAFPETAASPGEAPAIEPDYSILTGPAVPTTAPEEAEEDFSAVTEEAPDEPAAIDEPPARPAPASRPTPAPVQTSPAAPDDFSTMMEPVQDELDSPADPGLVDLQSLSPSPESTEEADSVPEADGPPAEAAPAPGKSPQIFNPVPAPTRAGSR